MTGREVVVGNPVTAVPGNTVNAIATCPEGKVTTGGGIVTLPSDASFTNEITYPDPNLPDTWLARAVNEGDIEGTVQAYAVCVDDTTQ
ncbi:hypothetical protein ACIQ7Q_11470 [Streptomyces sp. NPDC096176]|uniref:hypothetical protein n=1 Tax=Streptomyces sp. NPDC096176 TaxID=3366079 RepID=UPI00380B9439